MHIEIKLFRLTKLFYALYRNEAAVIEQLEKLTGNNEYWRVWMERFHQLNASKETQILMLRKMGVSYRDIQYMLKISPNTIQEIVNHYDIEFTPLYVLADMEPHIDFIERRLEKEGIKLW